MRFLRAVGEFPRDFFGFFEDRPFLTSVLAFTVICCSFVGTGVFLTLKKLEHETMLATARIEADLALTAIRHDFEKECLNMRLVAKWRTVTDSVEMICETYYAVHSKTPKLERLQRER